MKMTYYWALGWSVGVFLNASAAASLGTRLGAVVEAEMQEWGIGGVALALVQNQDVLFAAGYGEAKRDSIFRVGSISKLFNAIAVMQQVEAGQLDLDASIAEGILPLNPFPGRPAVTLRQLLCHRSGLQREGAVGGYIDDSAPSLTATVASLRHGVLVTEPGVKMRYSNIGPSLAGSLVSQVSGLSYAAYQQARVLGPLGMDSSAWQLSSVDRQRLIVSHMRVTDGAGAWTRRETPVFDLGTLPAGNLFSTVDDLARFASALVSGGKGVVSASTLAEMWRPQLTESERGFGLGFSVGKFRSHRTVSHSGAVYGHSTSFVVLPDAKLAVIVLANEDIANGRVRRMSQAGLELLLEHALGEPLSEPEPTLPLESLAAYAGHYESQSYWAELRVVEGQLSGDLSGQPTQFRPVGTDRFEVNNRITDRGRVTFDRDDSGAVVGFSMGSQRYQRVMSPDRRLPESWRGLLGAYGIDFIPIVVSERYGNLYAMTENMVDYRLTPVNRNVWALPPGMYVDEEVIFFMNPAGRAYRINYANMVFDRIVTKKEAR